MTRRIPKVVPTYVLIKTADGLAFVGALAEMGVHRLNVEILRRIASRP